MATGRRGEFLRNALLVISLALLFLTGLGRPELSDPDESRHAEIAREMVATRHFLTPRLGAEPYYDKPPGFHWLIALSLEVVGHSTVAARLPSALAALATLTITAWWAFRLYGPVAARWAALFLGTTYLFTALGHMANIDILFTALLTGAAAIASVATERQSVTRSSILAAYALIGIATLVKGPVAILLALPAWIVAGASCDGGGWRWIEPWRGPIVTMAVALPWYIAATSDDPMYIRTFLSTHNLSRFLGDPSLPHQRSFVYYIVSLPLAMLPWTPYIVAAILERTRTSTLRPGERVVVAWVAGVFAFFALAETRLVTYWLPAFPGIAVLSAGSFTTSREFATARTRRWSARYAKICAALIAAALVAAITLFWISAPELSSPFARGGLGAVAVIYAAASWRYLRSSSPPLERALSVVAAGCFVAALGAYGPVAGLLTEAKGYRDLSDALKPVLAPGTNVMSLSRAAYALAFYSRRTIRPVADRDAARSELAAPAAVLILTKKSHADALMEESDGELELVWRNAQGTSLIANRYAAAGMAEKGGSRTLRRP